MILGSKYNRRAQKGDYMPVKDCHCLNMLTAIIDEYKRNPKRLKTILLNTTHWRLFADDMKRLNELPENKDVNIEINATEGIKIPDSDVTIKKGSRFQEREFMYEFYPAVTMPLSTVEKATA